MLFSNLRTKASRPRSPIIPSVRPADAKKFKEVFVEAQNIMKEDLPRPEGQDQESAEEQEQESAEEQDQGREQEAPDGVTDKLAELTVREDSQSASADS